jgi:hypothetical protein
MTLDVGVVRRGIISRASLGPIARFSNIGLILLPSRISASEQAAVG